MRLISSRDNASIKRIAALSASGRDRRKHGQTVLDGAHLLDAALRADWPLREVVVSDAGLLRAEIEALLARVQGRAELLQVPERLFAALSPVDTPSGILAVIDLPAPPPPRPFDDSLLLLDGVQDAGNLGSILRTAAAAGLADVLLTPGCAQAWSPRVLRAGMGAHFLLRIHEQVDAAARLADYPGPCLATVLDAGAQSLYALDLDRPVAWLLGAEGQGLSPAVRALASSTVFIPMHAALESLNVAAAAAVCLFEQCRQRRHRGMSAAVAKSTGIPS